MKKYSQYKGYIIAVDKEGMLHIFTKEEWAYGQGYRSSEWEADSLHEIKDFIDSY